MSAVEAGFSQTYAEARERFLSAAKAAGCALEAHAHPLRGRDGEALAVDAARLGDADAARLLVVTSGCHGVEGFCGSGIQVALLRDDAFRAAARAQGVALVFVHALNPWGFSWWRRTTEDNVDLNRNFVDFSPPLPSSPAYLELREALVPANWPPPAEAEQQIADFAARHGERALQAAISAGQHDAPDGLFFAGHGPTWSHRTWRAVLRAHAARCRELAWIDLHTGLGPNGHGERILNERDDAALLARARAWWGPVTSIYDGSSTSAQLTGMAFGAVYDECPQARFTSIALEYGTQPLDAVMRALRADQWLQNHPHADDATRRAIKQQLRDAFYTDTPEWKERVVAQARDAAQQALTGLAAD